MEKDFVKGKTVDAKFKSVNKTLKHFSRRLHKTIIGVLPSSPIAQTIVSADASGAVFKALLPLKGAVEFACIYLNTPSEKSQIEVIFEDDHSKVIKNFQMSSHILLMDLDHRIERPTKLIITMDDFEALGIWTAVVYNIDYKFLDKNLFAIEEFEKSLKEIENVDKKE